MRLRIDTTGVQFFCTLAPEARTDRETGAPRLDRETNQPMFQIQVAALDETGAEVIRVSVAGEPTVAVGQMVTIEGLVAIPWSQGDRSGVAYRAAVIRTSGTPITAVGTETRGSSDRPGPGNKAA